MKKKNWRSSKAQKEVEMENVKESGVEIVEENFLQEEEEIVEPKKEVNRVDFFKQEIIRFNHVAGDLEKYLAEQGQWNGHVRQIVSRLKGLSMDVLVNLK